MKRALEGAGFISAYDRSAIGRTLGVRPPETLDETSARELAVKQGLGVVLSGSVGQARHRLRDCRQGVGDRLRQGNRQRARTGVEQGRGHGRGDEARRGRPQGARRRCVGVESAVRHGQPVGDVARRRAPVFARPRTRRATASSRTRARTRLKAVELDPKFGIGYQLAGRRLAQPGHAAGRAEVHRRSAPSSRRDDRTRASHRRAGSTTGSRATTSSA